MDDYKKKLTPTPQASPNDDDDNIIVKGFDKINDFLFAKPKDATAQETPVQPSPQPQQQDDEDPKAKASKAFKNMSLIK